MTGDGGGIPRQAVFLVGGRGTRLGTLTNGTPKPLLTVGDRPFLDHLINEAIRFGIDRILLLCGYRAGDIADRYAGCKFPGTDFDIVVETAPAGTGGAIRNAAGKLDDVFFLTNGDSYFDINWLDLAVGERSGEWIGRLALKAISPGGRYGRVSLDGSRIDAFHAAAPDLTGPMNAGLYVLRRSVTGWIDKSPCSLEQDVFPRLTAAGLLMGRVYDRFFLDIGVPEDFGRAQVEVPDCLSRPAAFLPLACVLAHNGGFAGVKLLNDCGYYVFLTANRSDSPVLKSLSEGLRAVGAHFDDVEDLYADAGQALGCMARWPVDRQGSFAVAERRDDLGRFVAAGLPALLLSGGSLLDLATAVIRAGITGWNQPLTR
ncbi:D-glycero-D-manno-heptose 1,7-bisphosphate phosphatase [Skermanella aerolata]|uniref:sugar phosphate nucleotidyltransferase n=1 Tax=Skermanella aerolata TaxID=393310 RepID=UPI003D1D14E7